MSKKLRVGELFAGIGGIGLGLERTGGFEVVWQVENNDYATKVLEKNWPDVTRHDDVRTFPPEKGEWDVDLITAGFPCQDISLAGKGKGLDGKRSGLFYEVVRIVDRLRPAAVLLENVSALLTRGLDSVLGEMATLGYDAEWHCIPAASVGAPHRRDRIYIMAYANDSGGGASKCKANKDGSSAVKGREEQPQSKPSRQCKDMAYPAGIGQQKQGASRDGLCKEASITREAVVAFNGRIRNQWESEPDVGRVANGVPRRMDRLKCLGNAVVPQVVQLLGEMMLTRLEAEDE